MIRSDPGPVRQYAHMLNGRQFFATTQRPVIPGKEGQSLSFTQTVVKVVRKRFAQKHPPPTAVKGPQLQGPGHELGWGH